MRAIRVIFKTIGFLLLAAFIFAATIAFIYFGSGYRFDWKSRQVYRTGLILVTSYPSRANIFLDDRMLKKKTPYRIEGLKPGDYKLRVEKDGFRTWAKTLTVQEILVTWAQYVVLLPKELPQKVEKLRVIDYKISKNGRRAALITDKLGTPELVFFDLSKGEVQKTITIPEIKNADSWKIREFSDNQNSVLFYAEFSTQPGRKEWLTANIDKQSAQDISKTFEIAAADLTYKPGKSDEIYWLDENVLSTLNILDKSITKTYSGVIDFDKAKNKLLAVVSTPAGASLYRLDSDGTNSEELLPALPISDQYQIIGSSYNQGVIIVLAEGVKSVILIPSKGTSIAFENQPDNIELSPEGRYLAMYSASHVWTYDFDQQKESSFEVNNLIELNWFFKGSQLLLNEGDKISFADFDGTNKFELLKSGEMPESSAPLKKIFAIDTSLTSENTFGSLTSLDLSASF